MEEEKLKQRALDYHASPIPGKLATLLTKPTNSQDDLSLAYSPGVAEPVLAIAAKPESAYLYTGKGNLVAVITNGTSILGLGNMGALAAKPVMEGKAVLFKRFANIDVFDIEVEANSANDFIAVVEAIAPTFGGINLEDIKAPECFHIESELCKRLSIPVFHDDQHGTAIVVAAALLNALLLKNKNIASIKVVCIGAGAAGIASMRLLLALGVKKANLLLIDSVGVVHTERSDLNQYKQEFALKTACRTLKEAIVGADVFIGLAKPNLLTEEMLLSMAPNPIIFALSNPNPEIWPDTAYKIREDIIIATGRSDFPNQVNNVLCFPYMFRAALDVRAKCINQAMHIAAVEAIRHLVHEPPPEIVKQNYPRGEHLVFGEKYILPKPIDPRLKQAVSAAVAKAAIESQAAQ
ncbi:MAG: malate dehydrogenase [Legionellales bacterium RIFCSPHIGHO2_12_FULL_37_14]|nr:MAG: malate dehydrogenase [Legionellales bacterium RIFCSPHIGHO2_12_FULL_37_14]